MAFDAGMLACVIAEVRELSLGVRVEKVFLPERDEVVLQIRSLQGGKRLSINAGSNAPRVSFTSGQKENPMTPPMLCMLLRKHLQGAKLSDVRQEGFERVARLTFETRDEMGFATKRHLIAEIMGKYSNLIFTDAEDKILAALRTVDFSTSGLRQILPGMKYELPPKQNKQDPITATEGDFDRLYDAADGERPAAKWICDSFLGISAAVGREIAHRAVRSDATLAQCGREPLKQAFFALIESIKSHVFAPTMIKQNGTPVEYAFCALSHYGAGLEAVPYTSASQMLDDFFATRDRENHIRQRAADILRILTNAENRIRKKMDLQRAELEECRRGEEYKKCGDLITANLYRLSRGMTRVELVDYEDFHEDGTYGTAVITLDHRLTPAANAQAYYKKHKKAKTAEVELSRQLSIGEGELSYIASVRQALASCETAADLAEIREELYRSGYASKMKNYTAARKPTKPTVAEFCTSGGYTVLCGKNNVQNEYITHKLAGKNDYWFHVKGMPGSHAVMLCDGEEPDARDFTEAAEIAAYFSKGADGENVEVDYTLVRNVKKPAGAKPGFVIYHTNWSCVVTPNAEDIRARRKK